MNSYRHVFFDLDRTLWDFDKNASKTLEEIYHAFSLIERGVGSVEVFCATYRAINNSMWNDYRNGVISKQELRNQRFYKTMLEFSVDDSNMTNKMSDQYIAHSPIKTNLLPGTHEVLEYLHTKYQLHIITNGFEEVQHVKLKHSDLRKYFKEVITSEQAGVNKPNPKIFEYSLLKAGASPNESIMIGDDLHVDVLGAQNHGVDQVWFNPNKLVEKHNATHEISELKELLSFL